jgi:UDP-galactopyranose mutase
MPLQADYVVVGSGLTGATIARLLHDQGERVLVVERRSHMGGNVHDHVHPSGIRVHTYGPHYFRTNSEAIWAFVSRFATFYRYEARVVSWIDGHHEQWPVSHAYIARLVGDSWAPAFTGEPANFEEASLAMMPRVVYEKFVKGYSEKQWGLSARHLSAALARRFDVRKDDDPHFSRHRHQGLPMEGYAAFMRRMLDGIPVILNCDFLGERDAFRHAKCLIYTGPIDELFGWRLGRLQYRGQSREDEYVPAAGCVQPCGQVNNPDHAAGPHIRTLEWKHMMPPEYAGRITGTLTTRETTRTPTDPNQYEYPFPDAANQALYQRYRALAHALPNVLVCGRLGEYRYYDMDQAIGRAMQLARQVSASRARASSVARDLDAIEAVVAPPGVTAAAAGARDVAPAAVRTRRA